jgi:glucose/arabinose dehydrogenase
LNGAGYYSEGRYALLKSLSPLAIWVVALLLMLVGIPEAGAAPFSHPLGCGAVATDFRVTTFAGGLNFPYGMDRLADGSLIVATSRPRTSTSGYFATTGELRRLVDSNADGIADGPGTVVYTGLPGALTAVRRAGSLLFVTSAAAPSITVLRIGEPYTRIGEITLQFPLAGTEQWYHTSYALDVRPTPGAGAGTFDLFFNVGSQFNAGPTTGRVQVGGLVNPAVLVNGDAIHKITVTDGAGGPAFSAPLQIASGLRNAAGIAIHPVRGDLYFTDNGIDGLADDTEPLSADELNVIALEQIGVGDPHFFGFPDSYIEYRTGRVVGGAGIQPVVTFQPLAGMTSPESEGPALIAIAPLAFPPPFNDGVFIGFHGQPAYGVANEENPLVFYSFADGTYCHFVSNDEPAVGHLNGLLSTADAVFVADMAGNGSLGHAGAGTGVIYQITAAGPLVTIAATDAVATEGASTTGTLTVTRSGSTASALTVLYDVTGTASAGSDYEPLPGTLTIPAGSASAVITITTVSDTVVEGNETVIVTLESGAGYVVGAPDSAAVTIARDKAWVTITATDATATEARRTTGTFTVTRTGSTTEPLTVFYAVAGTATPGTDYPALPGSVTIAAGAVSAPIVITPTDDLLMERNETVVLTLDASAAYRVGTPKTARLTIVSNEAVTIAATDATATETDATTGRFTVSRTGSTTAPLTVFYTVGGTATAGSDYVSLPGSVTIPAGARQADVIVTPIDDGAHEGPETVVVNLVANAGYRLGGTTSATVTIISAE